MQEWAAPKSRGWWLIALLAVAIGAASWTWLTRTSGNPRAVNLEALGVHGQVPDFALVERSGRRVTLADLQGKVWLANFIYTECTETCPTQSLRLSHLQGEFAAAPDLRLVSITVDPEHDTPEILARYAERYHADAERWLFLTGPKRAIYALARDGFKLGVVDQQGFIMHSSRLVLVDRQARVRAYHQHDDPESLARLRDNLRALLAER